MRYRKHIIDDALDELFPHLAAIALEGAKGVGKTVTASQRVKTVLNLTETILTGMRNAQQNITYNDLHKVCEHYFGNLGKQVRRTRSSRPVAGRSPRQ